MLRLLLVVLLLAACSHRPHVTPARLGELDCVDGCLVRAVACLDWSASDTRWLFPFGPWVFWKGDSPEVNAEACKVDLRRCERACELNPKAMERAYDVTPQRVVGPVRGPVRSSVPAAIVDGGSP